MKSPPNAEFPIIGTRAAKEFHEAVAASTEGFLTYHSEWLRLSGLSRKTSSVHIHRSMCEALRLMHTFDQLDVSALAVGEHLSRWIIQMELAVERKPLAPDFSGLDTVSGTAQLPDGRAATTKFSEWVLGRLKERASLWKQERLFRQERRQLRIGGGRNDDADDSSSEQARKGKRRSKKKKRGKGDQTRGASRSGSAATMSPKLGGPMPGTTSGPPKHRRHGDPFPLPRLSTEKGGDFSYTKLHRRVDAALRSLNNLAATSTVPISSSPPPLTSVQDWMLGDVWRRVAQYGEMPSTVSEAKAPGNLNKRAHLYSQEANHLVGTDLEKIKILRRRLSPLSGAR